MSESTSTDQPYRLFRSHAGEVVVALILSATVVAAAWSAFQTGKWSGAMTVAFAEAAESRTVAASDIAQASRDLATDRATFSAFVLASSAGDSSATALLFGEFRDEVQPLIEEWLAKDPFTDPSVGSPFDDDRYTVFDTIDMAVAELDEAESSTAAALDAKSNAGAYTLLTVLFAIVLFLAGISRQFGIRAVTISLAVISSGLLLFGVGAFIALPTLV